jgi:hypothetical protein
VAVLAQPLPLLQARRRLLRRQGQVAGRLTSSCKRADACFAAKAKSPAAWRAPGLSERDKPPLQSAGTLRAHDTTDDISPVRRVCCTAVCYVQLSIAK